MRRLCSECRLDDAETDRLIDTTQHATLTREDLLALFYDTFEKLADAEHCEPCAEAVLDAADEDGPS